MPRLFRIDPRLLLDEHPSPADFREAMSLVHVGDTIKITDAGRHPVADSLLVDNLDLTGATIVDIGVSDGSTAVELIPKLPPFAAYVLADLYLELQAVRVGRTAVFYDHDGVCVLVAGARLMAWPSLSRAVRLLCWPWLARAARRRDREPVLLLNPTARALMAADPRVTARAHDVFEEWPAPAPDLIKVANLLRRLYFPDDQLTRALQVLLRSLDEGGHLLLVDNSREVGMGPRAGLYRRSGDAFAVVAETADTPEIGDLVRAVRLA
jgi:hypothetical protein